METAAMSGFRAKLAFCLDVISTIPQHPKLILILAKLAVARGCLTIGCWWTGTQVDDLRRELRRRERLQILGGDRS